MSDPDYRAIYEVTYKDGTEKGYSHFDEFENIEEIIGLHIAEADLIDPSIGNLVNLESFSLVSSNDILPENFWNLTKLKNLHLCHYIDDELPESLGNLVSLEELNIKMSDKITTLPQSIGNCSNLKKLEIDECNNFNFLPETIGKCINLEEIEWHTGCDGEGDHTHKHLPKSIGNLVNLKKLELIDGTVYLPESLGNCIVLEHLNIRCNTNLKSVPDFIYKLANLKFLDISYNKIYNTPYFANNEKLVIENRNWPRGF